VEDDLAFLAPWGVDLASVSAPVSLWHGLQNWPTPLSHSRWLAEAIPGAELRTFADEGALSVIFGHVSEVIDWLGAHLRGDR
jgi:pimeloyl-ACP methyl ester carboxylesterase